MENDNQATSSISELVRLTAPFHEFGERRIGKFNGIGVATLCSKEIKRFLKVIMQTVLAPVVTTLLFMAIFTLALGGAGRGVVGVPFQEFLAPGLIMMALIQNSFANSSSSLLVSKLQGSIIDVLLPPFSASELTFAYTIGGIARGLCVGSFVWFFMVIFVGITVSHLWAIIYFAVAASMMLATLGIMAGIWAEKPDHTAMVTHFIVTPLSFLSGTFYSIERLPEFLQILSQYNPFFYMIDGFRYGFIGRSDGSILVGVLLTAALNVLLIILCHRIFSSGYKLKD